ncbi:hypothetical protein [Methylobacterium oxalidis]|uniref:hypothetical protein n=1 Tax=Methylobacterium oxalidis TaxID=944322 RepID=UPI0014793E8F|nr:hypothetical protein [Methylobacterium oxalidis]
MALSGRPPASSILRSPHLRPGDDLEAASDIVAEVRRRDAERLTLRGSAVEALT